MGIVFDCFWSWQREFNSQKDPYFDLSDSSQSSQTHETVLAAPSLIGEKVMNVHEDIDASTILHGDEQLFPFLNDDFFPDWDSLAGFQMPSSAA
jgi:hypothetical protein